MTTLNTKTIHASYVIDLINNHKRFQRDYNFPIFWSIRQNLFSEVLTRDRFYPDLDLIWSSGSEPIENKCEKHKNNSHAKSSRHEPAIGKSVKN